MRSSLFFVFIALLVGGCGTRTVENADSDPPISNAHRAQLAPWFSEDQMKQIRAYEVAFESAASLQELEAAFEAASRLGDAVLNATDTLQGIAAMEFYNSFAGSDLGIPGLQASCVAECTEMTFSADISAFQEAAAHTPSPADDAFFRILSAYSWGPDFYGGDLQGYGRTFEQTWDYGGYSLLGEGLHASLLSSIDSLSARSEAYGRFMTSIRAGLFNDIVGSDACYGLPADLVTEELMRIRDLDTISETERQGVVERIRVIRAGAADVETGCREMPCDCSSG